MAVLQALWGEQQKWPHTHLTPFASMGSAMRRAPRSFRLAVGLSICGFQFAFALPSASAWGWGTRDRQTVDVESLPSSGGLTVSTSVGGAETRWTNGEAMRQRECRSSTNRCSKRPGRPRRNLECVPPDTRLLPRRRLPTGRRTAARGQCLRARRSACRRCLDAASPPHMLRHRRRANSDRPVSRDLLPSRLR